MSRGPSRRSWNFSSARSAFIQAAFDHVLRDLTEAGFACALVQAQDASVLHVHPTAPPDLATLPQAALTCHHFLKLKSGDLALVNDPSSGSFSLSTLTCVTAASLPDGDLLIAARFDTTRRLSESGKLEDEGVRVPPMPIASKRALNKDILSAMSAHPAAATDLVERIEAAADLLFEAARRFEALARAPGSTFDASGFRAYLSDSGAAFESVLAKLPLGSTIVTGRVLGTGEQVKLTLELSEKHVLFDFKGTESSSRIGLSELTTFGTCVWSVLALLSDDVPLTSATIGHFQISAPANTLLSSRAQLSLERGLSLVVPLLGELVHTALAKINPALRRAGTGGSEALAQIEFSSGRFVTLSAAPGTGAAVDESGQDAFAPWTPSRLFHVEKSESPSLLWTTRGLQPGSGGKGVKRGGDAEVVACRVLEAAKLRWHLGRSTLRPEGVSGGRNGTSGEIEITRASGAKETFDSLEGTLDLAAGDEVKLTASGGGAWGEPEASTP